MTFAAYYWAILTAALGITVVGMALAKALWPILQKHRWAIGEWDEA